jgi:hypothetical protein
VKLPDLLIQHITLRGLKYICKCKTVMLALCLPGHLYHIDMIYTFNVGAFKYITFFVVCMQLEYKVAKRSGYIINRIYTLDTQT